MAIEEAVNAGKQLDRIYLQNNIHGKSIEKIMKAAAALAQVRP